MADQIEAEVVFEERGALGLVILNRPKALNSLTADMCEAIHAKLNVWAVTDAIKAVAVIGAGEKAFCAGGDVVRVVKSYQAGGTEHSRFFRSEYLMNVAIDEFPKPYIAFVDGITMGGGVGVSIPGDYWVATEKTLFAMPETGLGLFPDVGGGWFLPRLPGASGMYLALSGDRLKAPDLYHLGIASHVINSAALDGILDQLAEGFEDQDQLEDILAAAHNAPETGPLSALQDQIEQHYAKPTVSDVIESLETGSDWAKDQAAALRTKSPTSLLLTHEQLERGGAMATFRENMQMEFRMVMRCVAGHDFPEGVRALLIDKDRQTNWSPATLDGISRDTIETYFASLGDDELLFEG